VEYHSNKTVDALATHFSTVIFWLDSGKL